MNYLLRVASLAEAGTGVALLVYPPIIVRMLFGADISGTGIFMSRIAGIALVGLGVACLPAANLRRAFIGMLTYSVLATGRTVGVLLWPAVAAHACLSVLLTLGRLKQPKNPA